MKPFFCGLAIVAAAVAAGPHGGGVASTGGRTSALGGAVAAHGAISRPLGGFAPAPASRTRRSAARLVPYAYSWYVPNYYGWDDSSYYSDAAYGAAAPYYGAPDSVASAAPAEPQPPVIINQYFGDRNPAPPQQAAEDHPETPGDAIGTPANYYLIAYKNHAVYTAVAYWVEDTTLHYVTTQNTHNQASLDLIDLDLTKSLNQKNDVPFSIPGR